MAHHVGDRTIRVSRGSAFTGDSPRYGYLASVDDSGAVRAWDAIAGHYTLCHALSPAQQAWIRSRAR